MRGMMRMRAKHRHHAPLIALVALLMAGTSGAQDRRNPPQPARGDAQDRVIPGMPAQENIEDRNPSPCVSYHWFVDVPTWASAARIPANFGPALQAAMQTYLPTSAPSVEAVLKERVIPQRGDGHQRFWTVQLQRALAPGELCGWANTLRAQARRLSLDTPLYVGRQCVVTALASPLASDWPRVVMGTPNPPAVGAPASVVLVDSGFKPTADWSAPGLRGARHAHGAAVKHAIDTLAPGGIGPLFDYRVLGRDGTGRIFNVARAIDAAIFERPGPLVLNLSIGWPPELERHRDLLGCAVEDPVGESVRYALAIAHLRDTGGLTRGPKAPTAVIAAAGNRATLYPADVTPYFETHLAVKGGSATGDCSAPSGDGLFYPAQWSQRKTCVEAPAGRFEIPGADNAITAVGATDHRDQRSPLSAREMTPPLVAPGVVDDATGRRWTGSSIAAAYVSTAVALRLRNGSGRTVVDAIRGEGVELPLGPGPRKMWRLRFPNPYVGAGPATLPSLTPVSGASVSAIGPSAQSQCVSTLTRWFVGSATSTEVQARCPRFLTHLDQFSVGGAGPQPPTDGCPECFAKVRARSPALPQSGQEVVADLYVQLTGIADGWDPAKVTISDPHLVVTWPDGKQTWIALGTTGTWKPGQSFKIKDLPLGGTDAEALAAKGAMTLEMQVTEAGKTSTNVSVVTLEGP